MKRFSFFIFYFYFTVSIALLCVLVSINVARPVDAALTKNKNVAAFGEQKKKQKSGTKRLFLSCVAQSPSFVDLVASETRVIDRKKTRYQQHERC